MNTRTPNDGHHQPGVEIPMPEEHYRRKGIGSRATFFRWERAGLRVLRVGGRRFIYPSDLVDFLERKNLEASMKRELP